MPKTARRVPLEVVDFDLTGEVSKADTEHQMVFGWAYVAQDANGQQIIDKSGEFISDPEELEMASYAFMLNSRVGKDWHDLVKDDSPNGPAASVVESVFFSKEKQAAMGIPEGVLPVGWWIGMKVHDPALWEEYRGGNRSMFSIHGQALARKTA